MATLAESLEAQEPSLMADALQIVTEVTTTEELPRAVAFHLDDVEHPKDQGDEDEDAGSTEHAGPATSEAASASSRGRKAKPGGSGGKTKVSRGGKKRGR